MELHLDGSVTINASPSRVFGLLTDPNFLAKTLPDSEDVRVIDGSTLEAKIKVGVAVASSTLKVKMMVAERAAPVKARLLVEGSGGGSSMRISSTFTLTGESTTKMSWTADADITGLIAGLGSTLLRSFATKKVEEIFGGITLAIEQTAR
ncbi:MAG: carbon monoxide dehydrogenase subunit G [Nitrososphaerales archaeon]|nr:carbon monoxide dehydrogenase subunit G [Nitrososphaerales archaeon]